MSFRRQAASLARALLIGSLLLWAAAGAHAQQLWGASSHGMTLDEVRAAFPAAQPPASPGTLNGGVVERLRLEPVEIANKQFRAHFYFAGDRLEQVTLNLIDKGSFPVTLLTFESLTDALRVRYGPAISRKLQRGMLNAASANWVSGKTNINLLAMGVGHAEAVLNVNYQVRLANEAGKL